MPKKRREREKEREGGKREIENKRTDVKKEREEGAERSRPTLSPRENMCNV